MLYKGSYVKGDAKMRAFCDHLSSCFQNVPPLGLNSEEINDKLFDIYHQNFSEEHINLWETFNLNISLETVVKMIGELKTSKDPGPMIISAAFLQYNVDLVAPIIQNAINTVLLTGRIPESWKVGYMTPIPKKGSSSQTIEE